MHKPEHIKACQKTLRGGALPLVAMMRAVGNARSCAPVSDRQFSIDMPFDGRVLHCLVNACIGRNVRCSGSASERLSSASCPNALFAPASADAKRHAATGRAALAQHTERPIPSFFSHPTFVRVGRFAVVKARSILIAAFGRGSENPVSEMGTKS